MNFLFERLILLASHSDTLKVVKGAAIAGGGVALTYLANHLGQLDLGEHAAVVAGILMVVINAARKSLANAVTVQETTDP